MLLHPFLKIWRDCSVGLSQYFLKRSGIRGERQMNAFPGMYQFFNNTCTKSLFLKAGLGYGMGFRIQCLVVLRIRICLGVVFQGKGHVAW